MSNETNLDFDNKMALINCDRIYEYAIKIDAIVTEDTQLEDWIKMKLTIVEQNIADVKHSLSGWAKFESGGIIFKKELLHIAKYAKDLIEMIKAGSQLMSWQENKLAISAENIDSIYHHLDYKMGNRASDLNKDDVEEMTINNSIEYKKGGGVKERVYLKQPLLIEKDADGFYSFDFDYGRTTGWAFDTDDIGVAICIMLGSEYATNEEIRALEINPRQLRNADRKDMLYWLSGGNRAWQYDSEYTENFDTIYDAIWKDEALRMKKAIVEFKTIGEVMDFLNQKYKEDAYFLYDAQDKGYYRNEEQEEMDRADEKYRKNDEYIESYAKEHYVNKDTSEVISELVSYFEENDIDYDYDRVEQLVYGYYNEMGDKTLNVFGKRKYALGGIAPKVSNSEARSKVDSRTPFRGSNVAGGFIGDVYLVESYGYYPLFVYKDGVWYENMNKFSASTAKQMSQVRPNAETVLSSLNELEAMYSKYGNGGNVGRDLIFKSKQKWEQNYDRKREWKEYKKEGWFANWFKDGGEVNKKYKVDVKSYNYANTLIHTKYFDTEESAKKFASQIDSWNDDGYAFNIYGYDKTSKKIKIDYFEYDDERIEEIKKNPKYKLCDNWELEMEVLSSKKTVIFSKNFDSFNKAKLYFQKLEGEDLFALINGEHWEENEEYKKGGNVGRDLIFKSKQKWEQNYDRKREWKEYKKEGWFANWFKDGGEAKENTYACPILEEVREISESQRQVAISTVQAIKDIVKSNKKDFDANSGNIDSQEEMLKNNLVDGEISADTLKRIVGCELSYPYQIVGAIKLQKCFLRPYYKLD